MPANPQIAAAAAEAPPCLWCGKRLQPQYQTTWDVFPNKRRVRSRTFTGHYGRQADDKFCNGACRNKFACHVAHFLRNGGRLLTPLGREITMPLMPSG